MGLDGARRAGPRAPRGRAFRLSPLASSSGDTKGAVSPGGSKLIGGNRPTSPQAWRIQYKALTESKVRPVLSSDVEGLKVSWSHKGGLRLVVAASAQTYSQLLTRSSSSAFA